MVLEILSAEGGDAERWTTLVAGLPRERRDIHFLPEYGRIYRDSYGFSPHLAVYRKADGYVIQPLVRRPLKDLSFLAGTRDANNFSDIANAYGFGGPVSNVSDVARARGLYQEFAERFAKWCEDENIASEFASLHPFMVQHQLEMMKGLLEPRREKEVVYIELAGSNSDVLAGLNRGQRSSISKAQRAGVRIERVETTARNLTGLNRLYYATMERRKAATRWFVPESFFANCIRHLGPGRTSLFFATVDGEVECAYLLMHEFDTAYYHFAGSSNERPELRASNLTMYETAIWAQQAGYRRYHLGGGVTSRADDSLLRFKAGFSDRRAPLYTYFCVRNARVYDLLCERKRAYERATTGAESSSDFLPVYRR